MIKRIIQQMLVWYYEFSAEFRSKDGSVRKCYYQWHAKYLKMNKYFTSERQVFREKGLSDEDCFSDRIRKEWDFFWTYETLGVEAAAFVSLDFAHKDKVWRAHHIGDMRLRFINQVLNNRPNSVRVIRNKVRFNNHFAEFINRRFCSLRKVSREEFVEMFKSVEKLIVKPVGSYGGKGIEMFTLVSDRDAGSIYDELSSREKNYVVEEVIRQSGYLHDIHPSSVNTIRVVTVRSAGRIHVIEAFLRCGAGGSFVDNFSSGGILFPVDVITGIIDLGHSAAESDIAIHPDTHIEIAGQCIPEWDKILEYVKEAHLFAPKGVDFIGWDVCSGDDGLSLIEGNSTPGFTSLKDPEFDMWKKMYRFLVRKMEKRR